MMEYRFLGNTGLRVSELCLGTMTFGREADEKTSFAIMDRFTEAGGTFIDSANVYSRGGSEEVVGRWLKNKTRYDFVIATKVRFPMGEGPNDAGLSKKHILKSVEDSLRRLQTDYIDLYQVHCWDPATPLEETLTTLDGLVKSGKVRYLGSSNFTGWQLQRALDLADEMLLGRFVCHQPQYNLMVRTAELEVLPVCQEEGLGVIPWSPLRGGWLSGKFRRGMKKPPAGSRIEVAEEKQYEETWNRYNRESTWKIIDALADTAEDLGKSIAQIALNWVLNRPGITAPIIGARTLEQLEQNLGCAGWMMDKELMEKLNKVSEPELSYPYDFVNRMQWRR
jgi:aryl-alcohol dehydrogenase-like predicted oxidoreductase